MKETRKRNHAVDAERGQKSITNQRIPLRGKILALFISETKACLVEGGGMAIVSNGRRGARVKAQLTSAEHARA